MSQNGWSRYKKLQVSSYQEVTEDEEAQVIVVVVVVVLFQLKLLHYLCPFVLQMLPFSSSTVLNFFSS